MLMAFLFGPRETSAHGGQAGGPGAEDAQQFSAIHDALLLVVETTARTMRTA
jgi:hypothetical protein